MQAVLADKVRRRAGHRCEYCRLHQRFDDLAFEIEHIVARKHKGPSVLENLALSCVACNRNKGTDLAGIDEVTGKRAWLFNPRKHLWRRHFRWNGPFLIGLTPSGRVTIHVLAINREDRVSYRESLIEEGIELDA